MDNQKQDQLFMKEALKQARRAMALGEVPIGCVVVQTRDYESGEEIEPRIVGRGYNRRNTDKNTLNHAELTAIRRASKKLGDWRLEGCTLYVTLEPCQMCSGALVQSRMDRCVIGCMNPKAGCAGSILNILQMPEFNHRVEITEGVMEQECSDILKEFFKSLRERNRKEKREQREGNC